MCHCGAINRGGHIGDAGRWIIAKRFTVAINTFAYQHTFYRRVVPVKGRCVLGADALSSAP